MTDAAVEFESLGRWPGVLSRIWSGVDLSEPEAACVLEQILSGESGSAQIASLVTALRMKGETVSEMTGFLRAMLAHAERLEIGGDLVDTCGTGGDGSGSINVSTAAAFVAAGAGARVCKHGGRAASSRAGSADVLEALGVAIDLGPEGVGRCISEVGIGFCFAPRFHPAMRFAAPVRKELGVPTIFNFLGPLANPARLRRQVVGVSDPAMAEKMIKVLVANGCERAMVVHGADGLDELSTTGPSTVLEAAEGDVRRYMVDPEELGFARAAISDLRGGDAAANARVMSSVLGGDEGPRRDIVVLNSAAALVVAGLASDLADGVDQAAAAIDAGKALAALEALVEVSTRERRAQGD